MNSFMHQKSYEFFWGVKCKCCISPYKRKGWGEMCVWVFVREWQGTLKHSFSPLLFLSSSSSYSVSSRRRQGDVGQLRGTRGRTCEHRFVWILLEVVCESSSTSNRTLNLRFGDPRSPQGEKCRSDLIL